MKRPMIALALASLTCSPLFAELQENVACTAPMAALGICAERGNVMWLGLSWTMAEETCTQALVDENRCRQSELGNPIEAFGKTVYDAMLHQWPFETRVVCGNEVGLGPSLFALGHCTRDQADSEEAIANPFTEEEWIDRFVPRIFDRMIRQYVDQKERQSRTSNEPKPER